ncbi:MAG: transcription termination factor NusA [Alphaproteobacteria bacterium]
MTEIGRHEIIQVATALAQEKGIPREDILEAMEQALQKVARARYGKDHDIRVHIDRQTGQMQLKRYREIVSEISHVPTQLNLEDVQTMGLDLREGDFHIEPLPNIEFGWVDAQTAKQTILSHIREAERQIQYGEFQDRVGEVVNGSVRRVEFDNYFLDLGKAEGFLRRDELIPREKFKIGDRVRAYIKEVRREAKGPQIFLSRTHPQFMAELFKQEVAEIYDGHIVIKAVARDAGSRAKMAVFSNDSSIDPVGSCVGMRGSRVQAVIQELQGEKIDIIPWSPDIATFVVNALAPAEVSKVVFGEESRRLEVVVPDDQLSLAIGRRGQNVRLAHELTGMAIDILTEAEESRRRTAETQSRTKLFIDALDVDDVIAHLLVLEGFETVEEIAFVPLEELLSLEGFTEEVVCELQNRAKTFLEKQTTEMMDRFEQLGGSEELAALEQLTPSLLAELAEKGIKTLDDLAELSGFELQELVVNTKLNLERANEIVMASRAHWFKDEAQF